ncbi:hypothetical protein HDU97_007041 [Phlyctochytrium planicorne]|nr:hypothetical protein HDU97_007041 [Phlyctochytrium planicorne]
MSTILPAPPARGASARIAEGGIVRHLRSTIDQLQSVIETQQTELSTLKSTLSESSKHNPTPIHLPVADLVATLRNLVKCSNVDNERNPFSKLSTSNPKTTWGVRHWISPN